MTIRLSVLGALDLRDSAGREVGAVLRQPKRLALLACLAIHGRGGFLRRDTLLGMFWPALDQEHARAALRRALYFLRRALGEAVLAGRGEEAIGIAAGALWCDAVAFEEAIERGDLTGALALYRGPLLEGFYVAGAAEAERWFDDTRRHLAGRAADTAWSLAEAPATPAATAAEWARRAIAIRPDDSTELERLLTLLELHGDRSGALRAYDDFARRLRLDLDAAPGARLTALAERIRTGAVAAPPATPQPHSVAILPFTVHGDPALAYLSDGMVDLLTTALDGAGGMRPLDPATLLAWLPLADPRAGPLPAQVRARFGARAVIHGSLTAGGGRLRLTATMSGAADETLGRVTLEAAGESQLFALVDALARELLGAWSPGPAGRLARVAAQATATLPALKAWLLGEHDLRLGRVVAARDHFARATTEDGAYAQAHYRLAGASAALALIGPAREASRQAMAHRDHLADRDQLLVEAQHAWLHGRIGEAERRYAAVTARWPEDRDAWFLLGDLLYHANPYRGRSSREARGPLERALALDPGHTGTLGRLARIAALEGRHADLDALVTRVLALSPGQDQALALRALRAWTLGRPDEQADVTVLLAGASALTLGIAFSDVAVFSGDLAGTARLGQALLEVARSDELRGYARLMLAMVAAARGRLDECRRLLEEASRHDAAWSLEVRGYLFSLPFLSWPSDEIRAVHARIEAWDATMAIPNLSPPLALHNEVHPHLRCWLLGQLAIRLGDGERAAEAAEALAELPVPEGEEVLVERLARGLVAAIQELRGQRAAALSTLAEAQVELWFQNAVASPFHAGTLERYRRARLLLQLGDPESGHRWAGTLAERSPWELVFRIADAELLGA